ncbi:noggin-1-like [Hoplias malabaricus]|uniref:noggin-1-like n=1 Tax=Hoplias malabaricus TaxID=27720 RepID=UPI00346295C5
MPRLLSLSLPLLSLMCLVRECACQHYYALRPAPSDALPIVELHEDPNPALDPAARDFNETELRRALGHLDARFLSVSPPPPPPHENEHDPAHEHSGGSGDLHAGPKKKNKNNMMMKKMKKKRRRRLWLRERALCPVSHAWTDLGARFWPRYVRLGSCSRERSCSVPPGMMCAPAASTHVTLLRWRCARRGSALRCAWIRVHYPVITECKCTCGSS